MFFPLTSIDFVRDDAVALGAPCEHCDNIDATVEINVYTRQFGECAMIAESCVSCGKTIATREGVAEVLVEIPLSLRAEVESALTGVNA